MLFVRVISGDNYRNDNISPLKEQQVFLWGNNPPESTFEALDWIVTSQKLKQIGYSKEQINSLYIIREKEILKFKNTTLNDDLESEDDVYGFDEKTEAGCDKNAPFNAVISIGTLESVKVTRGLADIE